MPNLANPDAVASMDDLAETEFSGVDIFNIAGIQYVAAVEEFPHRETIDREADPHVLKLPSMPAAGPDPIAG